nr:ABC transporter ATP-binding protein [Frigidibacter oleivorans]
MAETSGMTGAARVEIRGLSLSRGGRRVLDGLDLTLTERRVAVIGRNGSGKSTLARAICGLIAGDAGEVTVDGAAVARDRKAALARVGMIFQNPDHQIVFPTVGEELAFGLRQMKRSREEAGAAARAVLARFGHADWHDRPTGTLSQGQKHLVCLMAVLAMRPAVIVLDEPFTGLDMPTARHLRRVLDGVDAMLIHVSHDLSALAGYDRALWLEAGRIAGDGPAAAVLADYARAMEAADAEPDLGT